MSILKDDRPEDAESLSDAYRVEEIDRTASAPVTRKDAWDRQIEEDAKAGRLDEIAREVKEDYENGRTNLL